MNNLIKIILVVLVVFLLLNYSCGKKITENFSKKKIIYKKKKKCKNLGRKYWNGKCTKKNV